MTQALEQFFEGGATAAKFEDRQYGTVIGGEITADPVMRQQRDYESGEPMTYPDGNPAMQMVITVQAHPAAEGDDGQRAFYVKGQLKQAIGEALRKAGAKVPQRGGKLWVKYVEDKPSVLKNGRPGNPQKIYQAKYEAPAQAAASAYFDAPNGGAVNGGLPCPEGVDAGRWADMSREQQRQLADALGVGVAAAATPAASFAAGEPPF